MSISRSNCASRSATFFFEQTQSFDAWELRWLLEYWQGLCDGSDCPRLIDVGLPAIARQAPPPAIAGPSPARAGILEPQGQGAQLNRA